MPKNAIRKLTTILEFAVPSLVDMNPSMPPPSTNIRGSKTLYCPSMMSSNYFVRVEPALSPRDLWLDINVIGVSARRLHHGRSVHRSAFVRFSYIISHILGRKRAAEDTPHTTRASKAVKADTSASPAKGSRGAKKVSKVRRSSQ
jgi:hypothetical protein